MDGNKGINTLLQATFEIGRRLNETSKIINRFNIELTWPWRKYLYYQRQRWLKCPYMNDSGCNLINHYAKGFYDKYKRKPYKMESLQEFKQEAFAGMLLYKDSWRAEEFKPEEIIFKAIRKHFAIIYKECQTKQRIADNSSRHLEYIGEYTEANAVQGNYWQGVYKHESSRIDKEKERADFDLITQNFEFYYSYEGYKTSIEEGGQYQKTQPEEGFKNWRIGGISLINGRLDYKPNPVEWEEYDKGNIYYYDQLKTNPQPWQKYEKEPGGGRLADYIRHGIDNNNYCPACNMALTPGGECMNSCTGQNIAARKALNFNINDLPFIDYKNFTEPEYKHLKKKREYPESQEEREKQGIYIYSDPYMIKAKHKLPFYQEEPVKDLSTLSPAVKKNTIKKWLHKPARVKEVIKAKPVKFTGGEPVQECANNTGHNNAPAQIYFYRQTDNIKQVESRGKFILTMDQGGKWQLTDEPGGPVNIVVSEFIEVEESFIIEEAAKVIYNLPGLEGKALLYKYLIAEIIALYDRRYISELLKIGITDQRGRYYQKPLYINDAKMPDNKRVARVLKRSNQAVNSAVNNALRVVHVELLKNPAMAEYINSELKEPVKQSLRSWPQLNSRQLNMIENSKQSAKGYYISYSINDSKEHIEQLRKSAKRELKNI